jgi:hypothetical protein
MQKAGHGSARYTEDECRVGVLPESGQFAEILGFQTFAGILCIKFTPMTLDNTVSASAIKQLAGIKDVLGSQHAGLGGVSGH